MENLFDTKIRKYLACFLALAIAMLFVAWRELPEKKMQIFFFDVGQGDAILIQTPEGHNVLVDGGPKTDIMQNLSDALPFFNRTIDLMVLTHPHADHLEGLTEILKRYKVKSVLLTGVSYNNVYYHEFLEDIDRLSKNGDINLFIAHSRMDFKIGSVYFDILYPIFEIAGREIKNVNNSSIVMRISYNDDSDVWHNILLSGDCEEICENEILANKFHLKSDIYKVGHHGSKTASSYSYVKAISPKTAVIQCGEGNKFGHPHAEVLKIFYNLNVRQILRNDIDGTIQMEF